MSIRFAFAGFRHGHINAMYGHAAQHDEIDIVGACEDHPETRNALATTDITLTHDTIDNLLSDVECDVVAVGDYYARRGSLMIKALEAGKHVIADKPICVTRAELDKIESLARAGNLTVGAMLDMRDAGCFITARECIRSGDFGEIHGITFGGQHPLALGVRPEWYFESGKHGGTINDIGIHAVDLIPWICDVPLATVESARCWNAFAPDYPHFNDAAQMMLTMQNGAGVLGDVSYFVPDSLGYQHPWYWRFTFWGRKGVLEASYCKSTVSVAFQGDKEPRDIECAAAAPGKYLKDFLADLNGNATPCGLNTQTVIDASRKTLLIQEAGDQGECRVSL